MRLSILGVPIDQVTQSETLEFIAKMIIGVNQNLIATVNPEFVVEAQNNTGFREVLNTTAINTCDGTGLVYAGKFLFGQKLKRVTGVDLTQELLLGKVSGAKIFLLGGAPGVAQLVWDKYAQSPIVGVDDGGKLIKFGQGRYILEKNNEVIEKIKQSGANILLVAFGQVRQELWLADNLSALPSVRVGIGIGGTFDYLSGRVKRPPTWVRRAGLEWLYRLIVMPERAWRIYNASVKFVWLVLKEKMKHK